MLIVKTFLKSILDGYRHKHRLFFPFPAWLSSNVSTLHPVDPESSSVLRRLPDRIATEEVKSPFLSWFNGIYRDLMGFYSDSMGFIVI